MTDNGLSPIGGMVPRPAESTDRPKRAAPPRRKERADWQAASSVQQVASALPDVRLHFRIDPKTNDVTVVLVDKGTERVIRTIPPDKLRELARGELVELLT